MPKQPLFFPNSFANQPNLASKIAWFPAPCLYFVRKIESNLFTKDLRITVHIKQEIVKS